MRSLVPSRNLALSALVLISLLASWLRIYRIDYQSYWNDEGNSLGLAGRGVTAILLSAAADIHPPGYYLGLKVWRTLVGDSELALRGFSALAGIVLVALLYRLGREYFDTPAATAAASLVALNPFVIYYSQEARMYALLTTLGAASFLLFTRWLKSSRPPAPPFGDWKLAVGYALVSACGLYTHYAFPFVLLAQNLAALGGLLAHRRGAWRQRLGAWLGLQAVTLALFLPWLPTAVRQVTTWPAAREFHPFLSALADVTRFLAFGRTIPTQDVLLALASVGVLVLLGLRRGGQTITPLLWLVVPTGLTLAFGLLSEAFSKFLLVAVPPLCLLMGNGLIPGLKAQDPRRTMRHLAFDIFHFSLVITLAAGLVHGTYLSLNNLYFNPAYFRDDYRGIARYVEGVERAGDAIIAIAPNQVEAFGYYHRSGAQVFPVPHQRPLDKTETAAALADIVARHDRLFVLYWGEQQADPEYFVEGWLSTHAFKAGEQWYGQVRLATYSASTSATAIATPSAARFGDHITLEGYTLQSSTLSPGDILPITLFWYTDATLNERYKVFVHVYAELDQPPVAQHDGEPGGGLRPTTSWEPGRQVADNHGVLIPADLPTGRYHLVIGLYNLFGQTRLPMTAGGEAVGDRLELGTITVR